MKGDLLNEQRQTDGLPGETGDTASGNGAEETPVSVIEADVAEPRRIIARRGTTFESFAFRDYTLFWSGALVSNMGTWMQNYALAIVVYGLRRSEFDSGLVNFVSGIPVLFLALPAGALADRIDKRRLLITAQLVLMLQAGALAVLFSIGWLEPSSPIRALVWIAALGLLGGVMAALSFPAWQAILPDLVPRRSLLNAIALNSAQFQSARLLGPLVAAGLVLVGATMGDLFWVNAASFIFVILSLAAIRPHPDHDTTEPAAGRAREGKGAWHTLTAGLRYAREHRSIGVLIASTAVMTTFGMPYMMLLPAITDKVLGGGRAETAYLMAANGFGAIFGALVVAGLPVHAKRERLVPAALVAFSLMLIGFSLSRSLALSMVLSALAGAGILTVNSLTNTMIQSAVPQQLRGRVMALFVMAFMGIMPISSLIFGPLGELVGPGRAVLMGAVVLLGWSLVLLLNRSLLAQCAECLDGNRT